MEDLAQKLKEFRISTGLSQSEIAEKLDIPQTTWSGYERGRSNPKANVLIALEKLGFQYKIPTIGAAEQIERAMERAQEQVREQSQISQPLDRSRPREIEGKLIKYGTENSVPDGGFVIPLLDQNLSAGYGAFLPDDDTPVAYIAVPRQLRRFGEKLAALYVDGDSMEPTYFRGDMIICDSLGWDGEGVYAIQMDGSGFVKRLSRKPGKLVVISDNPRYETYEVPFDTDDIRIIGKVRGVLSLQ
ncbi:LexA family transcriptional regulator [Treponema vincentii]|uniref:LexA family transcriptional regulator n=1 Tax=Treponema vincentii TaxID=69710 RepID=UPI0020A2C85A|nr:S24 family peptidase [Treponema vincentii]UTC47425.1 helix-turn-helix domain-containing protein [Treponema vincentii]